MRKEILKKLFILVFVIFYLNNLSAQEYVKHLNTGKEYLEKYYHKEKEALAELQKAYQLNPQDFEVLYYLGRAYYDNRKYDDAEEMLSKAVELKPNHVEANAYLAYTLGRIGENIIKRAIYMVKAANQIKKTLILNPKHAGAWRSLAIATTYLGWFGKPSGLFQTVLNVFLNDKKVSKEVEEIFKSNNIPEAVYKKTIKLDPKDPWNYVCLGWAYLKMKKPDKAKIEFEKAVKFASNDVRHGMKNDGALKGIALYCEEAGLWDEALKYAKMALSWNPKDLCLAPEYSIKKIITRLEQEKKLNKSLLKNVADEL